jgi:hypothetical protein
MASLVNSYFPKDTATEQSLFNGLKTEAIQVLGRTYYYLPRDLQKIDLVLGEDVISKFTLAIPIEMYMADTQGFQGDKEMFSKFGLSIQNSYTLIVSNDRWEAEVKTQFDNNALNGEATFDVLNNKRPQEGDLIYDPLTKFLMEIKFVDHDTEFYQVGKNYLYHLSCEAYQYDSQGIATGIAEIDAFETESFDLLQNQLLLETGDVLVQEFRGSILLEQDVTPPTIQYKTEFEGHATDIGFNVTNPFG